MQITTYQQAKSWFEANGFNLHGYLRHGGDGLPVQLAAFGAGGQEAGQVISEISGLLHLLRHNRGSEFVKQHVFPLIRRASVFSREDVSNAASFLLTELRGLQSKPVAVHMGIGELSSDKLNEATARFVTLVNRQQFFDPEAYGNHYHKEPEHAVEKEKIVGNAGAELHGNVLLAEGGACAIIGDPRVGKGRVSFLLSHFHGFSIISDDRVHMLFSQRGAHVVGPYRRYGFRAASQFYSRGRMFYQGVFGELDSPEFPREVKDVFWKHGSNPAQLFKGKPVPGVGKAPLHDNLKPSPLKAVFLVQTHNSTSTTVHAATQQDVASYLAQRTDVGVPTVFGYPATYPLKTRLNSDQRLQLSRTLAAKLAQKGVKFYNIRVPLDPREIRRTTPSRDTKRGTPFDNRASAAEHIARIMEVA